MAEEVKIVFEIEGIPQSVSSVEDLQSALKGVESQSKKTEKSIDNIADATNTVGKNSGTAAKNAEGATKIIDEAFGGLGTKVKEVGGGMMTLGSSAVSSFKSAVMGANAMGKALIATGIGAIVVALGLIAANWDKIVGAISGVSSKQAQLLEDAKSEVIVRQQSLDSTLASENSLKLSGKSEKEIRDLKIQQTDETIIAMESQLILQKEQSKAQVEALERNAGIAQNVVRYLMIPVSILLAAVDALTYGLAKVGVLESGTNLEEKFSGGIAKLLFNPEKVKTEGDKANTELEANLVKLKNTRDGYILQNKAAETKAADDAKNTKADSNTNTVNYEKELNKELARLKAENIEDAELKAQALLEVERIAARQLLLDKKASVELLLEFDKLYGTKKQEITDKFKAIADAKKLEDDQTAIANQKIINDILNASLLPKVDDMFAKAQAELEAQRIIDEEKLKQAGATTDELIKLNQKYSDKSKKILEEETKFKEELRRQDIDNALKATSQVLGNIVDVVGESSIIGKAAAVAQTTIDTYVSATSAYKSMVGIPVVGPTLAPIAAGLAVATGLLNIKKILSVKIPGKGNGSSGSSGSIPTPAIPQAPVYDPNAALTSNTTGQRLDNQISLTNQTGSTGATIIKAYVVSTDISSQQEADRKINDLARL